MANGLGNGERAEPLAREGEHIAPAVDKEAFHCPWCGVLATQQWRELDLYQGIPAGVKRSDCSNCQKYLIWVDERIETSIYQWRMVFPNIGGGPRPHVDMPADVKADYNEARSIVALSPRGACALNRLAVQKLVNALVSGNSDLNTKIGKLVEQGLAPTVQQALDALRVVGNNAVHPGELDLQDDTETAIALFECMNLIVEDRITRPSRITKLYERLPDKAKAAIQRRDGLPGQS
jgi:hypothetical protein